MRVLAGLTLSTLFWIGTKSAQRYEEHKRQGAKK